MVIAVLLSGWTLAVPVELVDRLKDAPGLWAGTVSVAVVTCAVVTAGLGALRLFNAADGRRWLRAALIAALAATVIAGAFSAIMPEYGLLLLIPAVLAGVPGLVLLTKDAGVLMTGTARPGKGPGLAVSGACRRFVLPPCIV